MKLQLVALVLFAFSAHCVAQDAVKTDGDKYKVLLDNACVRVLDYRDTPGQASQTWSMLSQPPQIETHHAKAYCISPRHWSRLAPPDSTCHVHR